MHGMKSIYTFVDRPEHKVTHSNQSSCVLFVHICAAWMMGEPVHIAIYIYMDEIYFIAKILKQIISVCFSKKYCLLVFEFIPGVNV